VQGTKDVYRENIRVLIVVAGARLGFWSSMEEWTGGKSLGEQGGYIPVYGPKQMTELCCRAEWSDIV